MTKLNTGMLVPIAMLAIIACNYSNPVEQQKKQYLQSYKQAYSLKDPSSQQGFLLSIFNLDRSQSWALDSLFYSYYIDEKFGSASLLGVLIAKGHNTDLRFIRTITESLVKAKKPEVAIDYYGQWKNLDTLDLRADYGLARALLELERFDEAISVLSYTLSPETSADVLVEVNGQTVSLELASLNLIGICELKAGRRENGIEAFKTALRLAPNFVAAQNNLRKVVN